MIRAEAKNIGTADRNRKDTIGGLSPLIAAQSSLVESVWHIVALVVVAETCGLG